jgi:hypothetical protein
MAFTTVPSASAPDWCTAAMTSSMDPIVPNFSGVRIRAFEGDGTVVSVQAHEPRGCRP